MAEEIIIEKGMEKKEGVVCLPYEVKVVIPSECPKCTGAYGRLRDELVAIFGGATVTDGIGHWLDDDGKDIIEPVKIITASHGCLEESSKEDFKKAVRNAGVSSGQTAIFVKELVAWIIPPRRLEKKS